MSAWGAPALVSQIAASEFGLEVPEVGHRQRAEGAGVVHEQVEAVVRAPRRRTASTRSCRWPASAMSPGIAVDVVEVAGRLGEPGGVASVGDDGPAAVVEGVHQRAAEACGSAGDEGKGSVVTSHANESATSS